PGNEPFWTLARRPTRLRPTLTPFSTHQPPLTPLDKKDTPSCPANGLASTLRACAINNPIYSASNHTEMETMTPWQPQDAPQSGLDDDSSNLRSDTPPGQLVVSQGDALLLNTMDQQRTSAQEWMDLLQQGAATDDGASSLDADGEVPQCYEDSDTQSLEATRGSEVGDGEAMDVDMSTYNPGSFHPVM
ncbi:hypothetical protein C8A01DRAFT_18547, partial [Parachaetomium inaequale]